MMSESNTPSNNSLSGLNRKQMEAERLARLARKRPAPCEDGMNQHDDDDCKRVKTAQPSVVDLTGETHRDVDNRKQHVTNLAALCAEASSKRSTNDGPANHITGPKRPLQVHKPPPLTGSGCVPATLALQYPKGALKRTWAYGQIRSNDIKIEEVLQKHTLNIAVISSWQWDFDWMMTKFVPGQTKFYFVMEAKDEAEVCQMMPLSLIPNPWCSLLAVVYSLAF